MRFSLVVIEFLWVRQLSILFVRFNRQWNGLWQVEAFSLSILFVRFPWWQRAAGCWIQVSFNSLCEILGLLGRATIWLPLLSILFVRFIGLTLCPHLSNMLNFQFSLWDSFVNPYFCSSSLCFFQFSLWDSQKTFQHWKRNIRLPFNSLCEILFYDANVAIASHVTFNSLCEIPWLWTPLGRLGTRRSRREPISFNSLCEILGIVISFLAPRTRFQFSLWDP